MKTVRIAVAALGLAAFASAPALAEGGGCSSFGQTKAQTPPPASTVGS